MLDGDRWHSFHETCPDQQATVEVGVSSGRGIDLRDPEVHEPIGLVAHGVEQRMRIQHRVECPLPQLGGVLCGLLRAHLVRSPLAYVERVVPESPAARAGFEPDDLVFRLAGRTIRSCRDYDQVLESLAAGQEVEVVVKRGPALITLRLRLEAP